MERTIEGCVHALFEICEELMSERECRLHLNRVRETEMERTTEACVHALFRDGCGRSVNAITS